MNSLFTEITESEASSVVGGNFLNFYTGILGPDGNPLTDALATASAIGNSFADNGRTTGIAVTSTEAFNTTGVKATSLSHTYIQYFKL